MKMINALKAGECLENPALWKKLQSLLNLISGCSGVLILAIPSLRDYLTPENMASVGSALAALNVYFTNATSSQVGI